MHDSEMHWFFIGLGLGLAVSMPPGANTMMCIVKARQGTAKARPLIVAAALADGIYALLAGMGVLAALLAGATDVLAIASVMFLLVCAFLLWPRAKAPSSGSAVAVAAINPPAALLWLALASSLSVRPEGAIDIVLLACGAASATACWFSLVALSSARLSHTISDNMIANVAKTVSCLLVALAVIRLIALL